VHFSLGDETTQANADVVPTGIGITATEGNTEIVIATTGDPLVLVLRLV